MVDLGSSFIQKKNVIVNPPNRIMYANDLQYPPDNTYISNFPLSARVKLSPVFLQTKTQFSQ